ncbi:MAG TPA: RNA polymerase sigma-54 factor, partial [Verrucomicrobiae bacterium]|nr:RNA polymerase sigma-54 factor [Verrucomicrobiae bacterium]
MALSQVLAPQLQHSLQLLQAPTLELKALVEQELQQNPVLEEAVVTETDQEQKTSESEKDGAPSQLDPTEPPPDVNYDPATEKPSNEPVDDFQRDVERLLQLDQEWRDHFAQTNLPSRSSAEDEERRQYMFDSLVAGTSLQENLLEQVRMSELPDDQRPIAEMIIGNVDDNGYLQSSVEELAFSTSIAPEKIQEVLKTIQGFHPPGVAARNLRECLLLQLERANKRETIEYQIIDQYMEALGKRRLPEIARGLGVYVDEVQDAMENIARLEPRPGRAFL